MIADLVPNHTSDQHPWFQAAREGRDNPFHDFYVWADEKPEEKPGDVVFPDQENSNWAYDRKARQWYLHRFYSHQPDLNVANPEVRDEIAQVAGFWLEQGLSGFRLDAVPFLLEPMGMPEGAIPDPHELLRDLRRFMGRRSGEAILLGEVNLPPEEQREFFGARGGEELDLLFAFTVNQALYLALAREDAAPLADALEALPPIPADCQWAHFVRNHDELTLDKLTDAEREEVFAAFGPEPEHADLRPRAAPAAAAHARRRPAAHADGLLAHVLPARARRCSSTARRSGWPRTSAIEGRYSVRAPMQWSGEPHGGLHHRGRGRSARRRRTGRSASATSTSLRSGAIPESLLNWMERLIRRRRECPELGWGDWSLLEQDDRGLRAPRRLGRLDGRRRPQPRGPRDRARLALGAEGVLVDLFSADEPALDARAARARAARPPLVPPAPPGAARRAVAAWMVLRGMRDGPSSLGFTPISPGCVPLDKLVRGRVGCPYAP